MSRCSNSSPSFISLIFLSFFPSHPNTLFLLLLRPRLRVLFLLLFLIFFLFAQKVSQQTTSQLLHAQKVCSSSEKVHTCKISIFEESEERKKKKEKNNNNSSNNNICIATDR